MRLKLSQGIKKAHDFIMATLDELTCLTVTDLRDASQLIQVVTPVLMSKQLGHEDILAKLVVDAALTVMPSMPSRAKVNVDAIRVCKIMGGNLYQSTVVQGMVVTRTTEGVIKHATHAKVAVFGCGIETSATEAKSTVMIKSADELRSYNKGEEERLEEAIRSIAESGATVIIAGGSVSEMAMHFLEKYKLMVLRITSKWELRRLCKSVKATALVRLGAPMPEEMGYCDNVSVREMGGKKVTILNNNTSDSAMATIILRSSTQNVLNDMERAIDNGVNALKSICNDARCVPGAGATELELAQRLAAYGDATPGLDQYAIKKFAEALEIVPRILSENAGRVPRQVLATLYASHAAGNKNVGVNIDYDAPNAPTVDALGDKTSPIVDLLVCKKSALRLGSDVAITVLRVDQIIMAKTAGGPKPRGA